MTEEQHYALYFDGSEKPTGVLTDKLLGAAEEISRAFGGRKYRTEPISPEEAKRIEDSITNIPLSPAVEALFREHENEKNRGLRERK